MSGMDITLKQLQIFQAVVVAGSITKASRRVGLSQPSISQQLGKLEEKLGAQLIERNRTGIISLTPSGLAPSRTRLLLIRGEHKRRLFERAADGDDVAELPIRLAFTTPGARLRVHWAP